ncbi:MAG: Lipopolysaccharide heptosyltransferase [Pedosphaera sp.]|nr:Lipopolysaccharide heptosyltransferase [Pedosphaera sp.]
MPPQSPASPVPSERILIRGVNWLGDAVMSTPALLRLREARPQAHITLLTPEKLKDLWPRHPAIDAVQSFADGESPWRIGRRLRREKFDVGLIFPNSPRSALELWFAGIPQRIGYSRPWRNWLLTRSIPSRANEVSMRKRSAPEIQRLVQNGPTSAQSLPDSAHHIHQYLHLTAALGANPAPLAPRLEISEKQVANFVARFNLIPNPAEPPLWFGLNAGAEYGPAKRWLEDRFIEAAIQIQRLTRCRWLIFGLKKERETAIRIASNIYRATEDLFGTEEVEKNPHVIQLAGRTNLVELCAALKFCRVLLTNDSGPMHVAAALGTPVVVPFGSTSPELTGPGLPGDLRHHLLRANASCSPCFLRECPIDFRCMKDISVETVVRAVLRDAR